MSLRTPEFRQFGELTPQDFERHPVWILCYTADYSKPWYQDIDEETFRPWTEEFPAIVLGETLLVRAQFELRDGSRYTGFVTPLVEGYDTLPSGRRVGKLHHPLGRQQPHVFVANQTFGFWGGIVGISKQAQREFYAALGKTPAQVFPLRFQVDADLANGAMTGLVEGFYCTGDGSVRIENAQPESHAMDKIADVLQMECTITSGYPQPENPLGYCKEVYSNFCRRCGIFGPQKAPFRFKKSSRSPLKGFMQLNWVPDVFFVAPQIADEITRAGITGVSFGPAVAGRLKEELGDRVQMSTPTLIACAETSKLPPVTCRPNNEEAVALRAMFERWDKEHLSATASQRSPEKEERLRKLKEKLAAIPFCGKVKHHPPTSLAIIPNSTSGTPDLFQTAEWFGSGGQAFRLTLASHRFVDLVRERGWKGLTFRQVRDGGFSERG